MQTDWQPKPGDKFVHRPRTKAHPLIRALGVSGLFGAGYGNVGSSIYYALGLVALVALGATPICLLIAGVFFIFTALSYAEGTAMLPGAGGSAIFARHGFNDLASSIAGWALAFSYIVTIAISAYAAPSYLGYFWAPLKDSAILGTSAAIAIVFFLMLLNIVGIKESSILNVAFAILDVCTQVIIIVLAVVFLLQPQLLWHRVIDYWPSWSSLVFGIAVASIAYTGVETISQLSEETKRPAVNAPRALLLMMVVVLVLFAGISVAGFSAMTPSELAMEWARDPVAGIAQQLSVILIGEGMAQGLLLALCKFLPVLVAILAATILVVATNAGLMGISRLTFSLGRFQLIPLALSRVHHKFKTPYRAIIIFAAMAMILISSGYFAPDTFIILGGLYAFGSLLSFALSHASILRLRMTKPELPRPFKLRGNIKFRGYYLPITAILGLIATVAVWLVVVVVQFDTVWIGFGWMAIGMLVYYRFRRHKKLPLAGRAQEIKASVD